MRRNHFHSIMRRLALAVLILFVTGFGYTAQAKRTVLYIGDSITDGGWGNSGGSMAPSEERKLWDLNHIFGHSYMYICAATMMADCPGEFEMHNRGISGNTLADLEARWDKDAIALKPDVVSILIGTNDVDNALRKDGKFDVDSWKERYDSLLCRTERELPGVRIVLCTPFVAEVGKIGKADNYPLRKSAVGECAVAVAALAAAHNATLVPFDKLFDNLTSPSPDYWIWDGIHPTAAGHKKMADLWMETVGLTCGDSSEGN